MATIPGLPPLHWLDADAKGTAETDPETKSLSMTTSKETDWFNPPPGPSGPAALSNAPALVFQAPQNRDWQLSAKVTVDHQYLFDAGTLFVHQGRNDWCKLCFEYSPEKIPVVVSVVTRDVSDDANGPPMTGDNRNNVYLRISKCASYIAFHHSIGEGEQRSKKYWTLLRAFSLRDMNAPMSIGFLAQAPVGESCKAVFSDIKFEEATLSNLRDGT